MRYSQIKTSSPSEHGLRSRRDDLDSSAHSNTANPLHNDKNDSIEDNIDNATGSKEIELSNLPYSIIYDDQYAETNANPMRRDSDDSESDLLSHMTHFKDGTSNDDINNMQLSQISSVWTSSGLKRRLYHLLYPPDTPIPLQIWRLENIALPLSYLLVGTLQGLSTGVMTIFLLQINATEAQQSSILSLRSLPAAFKVLFGFISDSYPIFGYRRKFYMLIGWIISSLSMISLSILQYSGSRSNSIPAIALFYFLFGFGFWFADVAADSIMAEKTKLESTAAKGQLQSTCYACRFFALMCSITFATFMYDYMSPGSFFLLMGVLPWLATVPSIYFYQEQAVTCNPQVKVLFQEIWSTVCSRAVWQPLGFIFVFTSLQVSNAAWKQYLYTVLHFTSVQINSMLIISYITLYIAILIYKAYLRAVNYRLIYTVCIFLNAIFSVLQVLLILQLNHAIGLSDYLFSLGDDAVGEFIYGIQYLPSIILMAQLCPKGSEGTSYAMFTSVNNCALQVSSNLSTLFLSIWNVSKSTMENGNMSGMIKLTILTSAVQFSGIFILRLLPSGIDELKELDMTAKSSIGGFIFLFVVGTAIILSILNSLLNIFDPSWAGGS